MCFKRNTYVNDTRLPCACGKVYVCTLDRVPVGKDLPERLPHEIVRYAPAKVFMLLTSIPMPQHAKG